jgi:hypothetical protein
LSACAGCNWFKAGAGARIGRCGISGAMKTPRTAACESFQEAMPAYRSSGWWTEAARIRLAWWEANFDRLTWEELRELSEISRRWHEENGADPATFRKPEGRR